jgi:hypothetical protein
MGDCVPSDVATWYDQGMDGGTAVMVRPVSPAVCLVR